MTRRVAMSGDTSTDAESAPPMADAEGYRRVRARTEALAEPLSPEDQTVQSMPDVSPTKWHRAHTTWFFEEFILSKQPGYRAYDPAFFYLFNSYYEGAGPRQPRPRRGMITRPAMDEIRTYRGHVDDHICALFDRGDAPLGLVELGLHHEQQHQELLLMDIKHVLWQNPLRPTYSPEPAPARRPGPSGWVAHRGGLAEVGQDSTAQSFSFDNECPRHGEWLDPFEVCASLVTEGEWSEFIADNGYHRAELWLSDGWNTICSNNQHAPLYWESDGAGGWTVFDLEGGVRPIDEHRPVTHVSYYEAEAFAHWAGARLPTEAEWEAAVAAGGVSQVDTDGWQWTASAYLPYPRFTPNPGVVGEYNGKFMVGQHVLRGGARVTPPGHSRVTYRNFFPPSAQWAQTSVRLARDIIS